MALSTVGSEVSPSISELRSLTWRRFAAQRGAEGGDERMGHDVCVLGDFVEPHAVGLAEHRALVAWNDGVADLRREPDHREIHADRACDAAARAAQNDHTVGGKRAL